MKEFKGKIIVDEIGKKVIAVSRYKGKTVRGIAKCCDTDTFKVESGKALAVERCMQKIAEKIYKDKKEKLIKAQLDFDKARLQLSKAEKERNEALADTLHEEDKVQSILFYM